MTIPKPLKALLVTALLLCAAVVAFSFFYEADMKARIDDTQAKLETAQGRLRKQEKEYADVLAALPPVQAELDEVSPLAQAAYEQEQAMRQQRKDLRAEKSALEEQLAALIAQAEESGSEAHATLQAIAELEAALNSLALIP